jgi:hypothetical protein
MLTIHNYTKLELQNIGVGKWYVGAIYEQNREYAITLRSPGAGQRLVYLSRLVSTQPDGMRVYQYYDRNGRGTLRSVTFDFIQNPSNLLLSLKGFCL